MSTPSRGIEAPIALPLVAAIVSWGLLLSAQYSDLLLSVQGSNEYDPSAPEVVRPSIWLTLAAVAVFGVVSLIAQRRAVAARAALGPDHALARAAQRFTTLAVILALAATALVGVTTFLNGFLGRTGEVAEPLVRIANAYAPIVVATALLVVLLLGAFVLRRAAVPATASAAHPGGDDAVDARTGHPFTALAARLGVRASLGLAYATPIVLAALGLIIGLIVFDLTGTAPEAWVWVVIQAIIGAGIVAGTVLARAAADAAGGAGGAGGAGSAAGPGSAEHAPSAGALRGARSLAFVLSVVFAVVLTLMSLGYGSSAIARLSVAPSLFVDAFPRGDDARDGLIVTANGYGLEPGSTIVVTLEPGIGEVLELTVDRSTSASGEQEVVGPLEPGEYRVTAVGTSDDGRALEVMSAFAITASGGYELDTKAPAPVDDAPRLAAPDAEWLLDDLLPALLLLVLACAGIQATIVARNRE